MDKEKAEELLNKINELLEDAPPEEECTDEENEVYADMANLKQSLENGMPYFM